MKKTNQYVRAGMEVIFIGLSLAIVSIASSLVFHPEKVSTLEFWVVVGLKTIISVLAFNFVYWNAMANKKADPDSSLGKTFAEYAKYITVIYRNKSHALVRTKIELGNQIRFEETATSMLHTITNAISYGDLFTTVYDSNQKPSVVVGKCNDVIAKVTEERMLTKKEVRALKKIIKQVINGRVEFERFDYNQIVLNNDTEIKEYPKMYVDEKGDMFKKNMSSILSSAFMSAIITVLAMGERKDLFYEIVSNAATIGTAIFNANMYAAKQTLKLKNAYHSRQALLNEFIELPPDPKVPEIAPITQTPIVPAIVAVPEPSKKPL